MFKLTIWSRPKINYKKLKFCNAKNVFFISQHNDNINEKKMEIVKCDSVDNAIKLFLILATISGIYTTTLFNSL